LLNAEHDVSFLFKLSMEELKILVARISEVMHTADWLECQHSK